MPEKFLHAEAAYRETGSATRHCAMCSMYREHDLCTLVADIRWHGDCRYYERKRA